MKGELHPTKNRSSDGLRHLVPTRYFGIPGGGAEEARTSALPDQPCDYFLSAYGLSKNPLLAGARRGFVDLHVTADARLIGSVNFFLSFRPRSPTQDVPNCILPNKPRFVRYCGCGGRCCYCVHGQILSFVARPLR